MENIIISKKQAKELATQFFDAIAEFCKEHKEEYATFEQENTDD